MTASGGFVAADPKPEFLKQIAQVPSLGDRPGSRALSLSLLVHCLAGMLIFLLGYAARPRIVPAQYEVAEIIRGQTHLTFNRDAISAVKHPSHTARRSRLVLPAKSTSTQPNSSGEALKGEARRATAALMQSLRFRQIYGFYPGHDYQLPVRQSGEVPHISPEQFPPNFSQFVVIDITIDTRGAVADAEIVAGRVEAPIQQILLSAVRQFKYTPAKRDNVPVPSQLEIVVPVPG